MPPIKYADCKPIDPKPVTAWLVKFGNGTQVVLIAQAKAEIETMIEGLNEDRFTKKMGDFTIERVDLGRFVVNPISNLYTRFTSDGRKVGKNGTLRT